MHETFWNIQTFSRRALGMPFSIVEMGDVATPDIVFSDFVGVLGTSNRLDSSLTVCNAFSIRRLQEKIFLAFSANTKLQYVKSTIYTSWNYHLEENFVLGTKQVLEIHFL